MATKTEGRHAGEFLVSESNGDRSREEITVVSGQNLVAGAVLGVVTASGKYAAYDNTLSTGVQTAVGLLLSAVDASAADAGGVAILRDAEVNANEINWASQSAGNITAGIVELNAAGIFVRTAIG